MRAMGAGAAAAALAPLGCGRGTGKGPVRVEADRGQVRQALRAAVVMLGERLDEPRAWMLSRRRVRVLVDVAVAEVIEERQTVAVLSARDESGRRIERCFDEVTAATIAQTAEAIGAARGKRRSAARAIPPPVDHGAPVDVDPERLGHADWLERARVIAGRGDRAANSRIVYRAAWLRTDDDRLWCVSEDGDRHQRMVRSRVGATFVAWHGSTPQFGEAELSSGSGPAVARLDDAAIARATGDALALFTPGVPPGGRQVVLLDPAVVASIVEAHARIGRAPPSAPPFISITDDPTQAGFGRYWFDDDGRPAQVTPLIGGAGAGGGGLGARRSGVSWRIAPAPAQLMVAPGTAGADELEHGIDNGLVIEGVRDVHVDDRGMVTVRVARGRQLSGGVRTGRQWGDLEVRGTAAELLSDAIAVSRERREIAFETSGAPRSVTAPWMLTRARVGAARGDA